MPSELPPFRRVKRAYAAAIATGAFSGPSGSTLLKLQDFADGRFRAIFSIRYFQLAEGRVSPSKSQWNTLKKRLKRRDHSIFVFREYGEIDCGHTGKPRPGETCLFLDFAFLPD